MILRGKHSRRMASAQGVSILGGITEPLEEQELSKAEKQGNTEDFHINPLLQTL